MPWATKKPCGHPGCGELVSGARYCEKHLLPKSEGRRKYDRFRGSAASRGYDRNWKAVRREFLEEHPLCEDCLDDEREDIARGVTPQRVMAATEAHHVKKVAEHPELRLRTDNLRALCHDHHSRRTARGE